MSYLVNYCRQVKIKYYIHNKENKKELSHLNLAGGDLSPQTELRMVLSSGCSPVSAGRSPAAEGSDQLSSHQEWYRDAPNGCPV